MARNERLVHASPAAVFAVLADPRSYAYWVVGSNDIRDADRDWPKQSSRLHHTVKIGPLRIKDHSRVEDVQDGRFLQLKVKGRPLGTARVKLELEEAEGDTRVTMTEDPADRFSLFLFTPLKHLLVQGRNARSLDRLAALAEGRVAMPGEEPEASSPTAQTGVENPLARTRSRQVRNGVARGALAGFAGAIVMSVSTHLEMSLRGRPPSDAPARALGRIFGLSTRGKQRKRQLALAGHLVTSVSIGAAGGALLGAHMGPAPTGAALFALAMLPEIVIVPALGAAPPPWRWRPVDWAVTVGHHGVYAGTTAATYARLDARAHS